MTQPIWNTPSGSLGTYPATEYIYPQIILNATPVLPASNIEYFILSGFLPPGVSMTVDGIITGVPDVVTQETVYEFTVRAIDNYANFRDRYFTIGVSGSAAPQFLTEAGLLFTTIDSEWIEFSFEVNNPIKENILAFSILSGELPEGLEMNEHGIVRGYPIKPVTEITLPAVVTNASATVPFNPSLPNSSSYIICQSTFGFSIGRPVVFATNLANIIAGELYYIRNILSPTTFTISEAQFGPLLKLTAGNNLSRVTLLPFKQGKPVKRTSSFTVLVESLLGEQQRDFSIEVINQNLPVSEGGPGNIVGTRSPVILNTKPATFKLSDQDPYYGYYRVPPGNGVTYPDDERVFIGTYKSDNYFSFKIIGKSFDNFPIKYTFVDLPDGLRGNTDTGWITGNLKLNYIGVNNYYFQVRTYIVKNSNIVSDYYNFYLTVVNGMSNIVTWNTDTNLGTIDNGTLSSLYVSATADVPLLYAFDGGTLPPNLSVDSEGQITGYAAFQPSDEVLYQNQYKTFRFSIKAFSPSFPAISSVKTFILTVFQRFSTPTDTLYMKATPSAENRRLIESLLLSESLIPTSYLFRPQDPNFGKAKEVIYQHEYGIYASSIDEYIAAETINHYWRNITLGSIETAVAKDSNGNILYEVVYSKVIDNLVNPKGVSIKKEIVWPVPIDLNLGPWITSDTDIFTSYDEIQTQNFYTSLTPGDAVVLWPNSLENMRKQISDVLGQEHDFRILPQWMTSQQADGNTLGYTPAWVICYCKPDYVIDSEGNAVFDATGKQITYAQQIKFNIENNWKDNLGNPIRLNQINFQLDRFSVNKSLTYDYDNITSPPAWTSLPSATPVPDPINSKDFSVLFPRKTILPNKTQL